MKITIEMKAGDVEQKSVVEDVGSDETLPEAIELFERAIRGLGYHCNALIQESDIEDGKIEG